MNILVQEREAAFALHEYTEVAVIIDADHIHFRFTGSVGHAVDMIEVGVAMFDGDHSVMHIQAV